MELLHLTDTHLGAESWFRGAPPGWRRADDHLAAMKTALTPALHAEVDVVVHSGDLFDRSHPPARAVAEAHTLLAAVARVVPLLLFPGNHDRHGIRRHFPDGIPGVTLVDAPARLEVHGVGIAVVPYFRTATDWAAAAAPMAGVDLLVCHQSFHGARVPGYTFRVGAHDETVGAGELPAVGDILCGHIHPRQVIELGGSRIVHPGSTERTSFSESAQTKGYCRWSLGADSQFRWVDLPSRPMRVVSGPRDLVDLRAGTLVHIARTSDPELEFAALDAGAFLTPTRRSPPTQMRLFSRR